MARLSQQRPDDWEPFSEPWAIAVLDRTVEELSAAYGWTFEEVDEEGLGPMLHAGLAWDGRSRFFLSASHDAPENGVAVEVGAEEDHAAARRDLLAELGLEPEAFLAISEGGVWFARWDGSKGGRPATAAPREAG